VKKSIIFFWNRLLFSGKWSSSFSYFFLNLKKHASQKVKIFMLQASDLCKSTHNVVNYCKIAMNQNERGQGNQTKPFSLLIFFFKKSPNIKNWANVESNPLTQNCFIDCWLLGFFKNERVKLEGKNHIKCDCKCTSGILLAFFSIL